MTTHGDHPVLISARRKQRRPGPANPNYAIPRDQWPDVLRRVDQGESYRQIAQAYETTYQSVYRTVQKLRKQQRGGQA
ncbi:MAG TPA: helix-turn-helix domain-containing protein [Ktedonobacteraceae bacterium]